jgi:uncharacterized protein (TIGR02118 family)
MTVRLVFCLRRLPHLSQEEFLTYWRDHHAPLVRERAAAMRVRRYEQSHPLDLPAAAVVAGVRHAPDPFDGIASLWFDSVEDLEAGAATPEGRRAASELLEDERCFIDLERSPIWFVEDHREV